MRLSALAVAVFALTVDCSTASIGSPLLPGRSVTSVRAGNNRALRAGEAFGVEDREDRGLNGWSLKGVKAHIPWTKAGKVAAHKKRVAYAAKIAEDIRLDRLAVHQEAYINKWCAKWFVEGKTVDDVVEFAKNDLGRSDLVSQSMGKLYEEWLDALKLLKKEKHQSFLSKLWK